MRGTPILLIAAASAAMLLASCETKEPERKAVGPVSDNSKIPWNSQGPVTGQGQLGMLPQNQYRR